MAGLVKWIDNKFYSKFCNNWDDDLFRELVLRHMKPTDVYLDLGAGRGALPQMNFKGICKTAYGIDPEEVVKQNPFLDHAYVGLGDSMPFFEDNKFDIIASNNVLEHLEYPANFFAEVKRVLKPGGILITKTPNKNYFIMLLSGLMPTWMHKGYNKLRGRPEFDTFPTFYRANTAGAQKRLAKTSNLTVKECFYVEGRPEYLRITPITYLFGLMYERLVNFFNVQPMKIVIYSVFQKPDESK